MARLLGPIPADLSELAVFRELKAQLPANWWVVTNVCWSLRRSGEQLGRTTWVRDGQADFVVLAPGLGLLVLEVKGSRHVRVAGDGCWYRAASADGPWERVERSPPEQAIANAHQLAEHLARKLGLPKLACRFGYLVAYPQGALVSGSLPMFDSSTTVFKTQISSLRQRIQTAIQVRGPESLGAELSADLAESIAHVLCNAGLVIGPVDSAVDAKEDARAIDQLTRQQFAALQGVFRNPRVAVTGPAGSGKTVIAIWRLAAAVEEGRNALYLCYNKVLAEFLRRRHPSLATHIFHVDSYFARMVPAKRTVPAADLSRYFDEDLPGDVLDRQSLAADEEKLDVLIVDEGQDFGEFRLIAARELVKKDGDYLYCSDDRQDLYTRAGRAAVGADVLFSLVHNCRNTQEINKTGNRVLDEHVLPMPGLPVGVPATVRHCSNAREMAKIAWELARIWSDGSNKIAILSPARLDSSSMAERRSGHGLHLVADLGEWDAPGAVYFSTIKAFKGLEADAVIVVDIAGPQHAHSLEGGELYVACTRGRARLAVLCHTAAAAKALEA